MTAAASAPELSGHAPESHATGSAPKVALREPPPTTPASPRPVRGGWKARMPGWCRILANGLGFLLFFGTSFAVGVLLAPLMIFARWTRDRALFTRKLNGGLRVFSQLMRDLGCYAYWAPQLPPGYEDRAFLLIANHPSLLDVVLSLGAFPQLSCVAKGSWYRSWLTRSLLKRTEYIPGAGYDGDADVLEDVPVVGRIEAKLRSGVPVVVFPEGTRSKERSMNRFTRAAIEAAVRAEVPILPMFISLTPAFLMKGQPIYRPPKTLPVYEFEWFEPVETAGRDLDSKELTRRLQADYEARFQRLVRERDALASES